MNKVYIVIREAVEGDTIERVFKFEDSAEQYRERLVEERKGYTYPPYRVDEEFVW